MSVRSSDITTPAHMELRFLSLSDPSRCKAREILITPTGFEAKRKDFSDRPVLLDFTRQTHAGGLHRTCLVHPE